MKSLLFYPFHKGSETAHWPAGVLDLSFGCGRRPRRDKSLLLPLSFEFCSVISVISVVKLCCRAAILGTIRAAGRAGHGHRGPDRAVHRAEKTRSRVHRTLPFPRRQAPIHERLARQADLQVLRLRRGRGRVQIRRGSTTSSRSPRRCGILPSGRTSRCRARSSRWRRRQAWASRTCCAWRRSRPSFSAASSARPAGAMRWPTPARAA